jgi:hypothetical protein
VVLELPASMLTTMMPRNPACMRVRTLDDLLDGRGVAEACWQGSTQGQGGQSATAPILHGTGVPRVPGGSGRTQDETAESIAPRQRVPLLLEDRASGQAEACVITPQSLASLPTRRLVRVRPRPPLLAHPLGRKPGGWQPQQEHSEIGARGHHGDGHWCADGPTLHGSPGAPPIIAQRVARLDHLVVF